MPQVLRASDSSGRVCGSAPLLEKKYLMYYDLTRCLNPAVMAIGCNTKQVTLNELKFKIAISCWRFTFMYTTAEEIL